MQCATELLRQCVILIEAATVMQVCLYILYNSSPLICLLNAIQALSAPVSGVWSSTGCRICLDGHLKRAHFVAASSIYLPIYLSSFCLFPNLLPTPCLLFLTAVHFRFRSVFVTSFTVEASISIFTFLPAIHGLNQLSFVHRFLLIYRLK